MTHQTLSQKTWGLPSSTPTSCSKGTKPHPPSETVAWFLRRDEKNKPTGYSEG